MPKDATPTGIFEWLSRQCRSKATNASQLRYERMASQAAYSLPEVHKPLDHRNPGHWFHRGMIWDYVLSLEGAERILDIGPGDGWPSLLLARHFKEVVGIEPGATRLEVCRANAKKMRIRNADFEAMSACEMSFRPSSFDGIVAATSIEQTPDPAAALREVFRVLKVGGTFRLTYEAFESLAEPVREAICVAPGAEGIFLIDYIVAWTEKAVEQAFLIEVKPLAESNRKHLELWAKRCEQDQYPHRDPRLERGLVRTIKGIRRAEILNVQTFKLRHFKTQSLVRTLEKIGFVDVRPIAGGGWPAQQCGIEMIQSRRVEAAAPLMEEICRGAARIGIAMGSEQHGNVIARKPRGAGRPTKKKARRASKKKT